MTILGQVSTGPLPNYAVIAQAIRANAGIPSTETVGPRFPVGHSGTLTDYDQTVNMNEAAWSALSVSSGGGGSGASAADPYVIQNLRMDNSEAFGNACFNWNEASAAYHVKIVNCFFSGYTGGGGTIRIGTTNGTGSLVVERCTFGVDSEVQGHLNMISHAGDVTFDRCKFAHASTTGLSVAGMATTTTFTCTDCEFSDTAAAWAGSGVIGINCSNATTTTNYLIGHCKFDFTANNSVDAAINPRREATSLLIQNCDFIGCGRGIYKQAAGTTVSDQIVEYCRFTDQVLEHVYLREGTDHIYRYCEFNDNGAVTDSRGLYYEDSDGTNISGFEVHHCKFTKTSGELPAGGAHDVVNCNSGENVNYHDNWVVYAPYDALEIVKPRTGCQVINNVIDSAGTQCVDIYDNFPAVSADDLIVSHIYGVSRDGSPVVTFSGIDGFACSTIIGATTGTRAGNNAGTVTFYKNQAATADCANATLYGPIINALDGDLVANLCADGIGTVGGVIGIQGLDDIN